MKIALLIVASAITGVMFTLLTMRVINVRLHRMRGYRMKSVPVETTKRADKKSAETTKKVIWICLINGFAWVWCSYILAYLDKVQIAESLSQVAVTEIIGVVLAYSIKSAVENLSKNNCWPDKTTDSEQ